MIKLKFVCKLRKAAFRNVLGCKRATLSSCQNERSMLVEDTAPANIIDGPEHNAESKEGIRKDEAKRSRKLASHKA